MSVADPKPSRLVPLRDPRVRALVDLPTSSLYEMARKSPPHLPGIVRIGRRVMIDLVALESWVAGTQPATSEARWEATDGVA